MCIRDRWAISNERSVKITVETIVTCSPPRNPLLNDATRIAKKKKKKKTLSAPPLRAIKKTYHDRSIHRIIRADAARGRRIAEIILTSWERCEIDSGLPGYEVLNGS